MLHSGSDVSHMALSTHLCAHNLSLYQFLSELCVFVEEIGIICLRSNSDGVSGEQVSVSIDRGLGDWCKNDYKHSLSTVEAVVEAYKVDKKCKINEYFRKQKKTKYTMNDWKERKGRQT